MKNICSICGLDDLDIVYPSGKDILCKRCKEIVNKNAVKKDFNATHVKAALKNAVIFDRASIKINFLCYYTGIPCNVNPGFKSNNTSLERAFDLTFDHKEPSSGNGRGEELVVCLNLINQVKSNIPNKIFKEFIILLANLFENDIDSLELERELRKLLQIEERKNDNGVLIDVMSKMQNK